MKLTSVEKVKVIELHNHGLTPYQISKELGYNLRTVKEILEEYKDGEFEDRYTDDLRKWTEDKRKNQ